MSSIEHVWVVILAAGEGKSARNLTNDLWGTRSYDQISEAPREAGLTMEVIDATHARRGVFAPTEKGTVQ